MCWDKRKVSWNQPQRHLSFTVQEGNSGISYKARKLYQETHPHPSLGDSRLVTLQSLTATGGLKWSWHQQCWDGEREKKKTIIELRLKVFFSWFQSIVPGLGSFFWMLKTIQSEGPNAGIYVLLHAKLCHGRYNLTLKLSLQISLWSLAQDRNKINTNYKEACLRGLATLLLSTGRCLYTFL